MLASWRVLAQIGRYLQYTLTLGDLKEAFSRLKRYEFHRRTKALLKSRLGGPPGLI
ncbi:hypothetical protein KZ483_12290 [Paenibacillus sp. sptzw28]|uniref:hypothetical protein n=1 Tax=Paenibacillus sp. sptzw28 TaxID=715179 RepID=UPI001C6E1604|nr:hypothetical protein [Paenibacillus sp. sptzw28]QYR23600.1 hypothetical protein KZ483_12290 [Paenibacillus sp. sptzw28]